MLVYIRFIWERTNIEIFLKLSIFANFTVVLNIKTPIKIKLE